MKSLLVLFLPIGCIIGRNSMKRNGRDFSSLNCGVTDTLHYGEYAVIESPDFGEEKYPNKFKCTWKLVIPANSKVLFSCDSFHVKKGDYLYFEDTPVKGSKKGFSWDPVQYPDYDVTITLKFTTNKRKRGKGFRCFIDSEEQGFDPSSTTTAAPFSHLNDSCNCGIPNRSNRIIGGVETEANEYPWQVAIVSSTGYYPFCGGTLISNIHVLTAAHCTDEGNSDPNSIAVLGGSNWCLCWGWGGISSFFIHCLPCNSVQQNVLVTMTWLDLHKNKRVTAEDKCKELKLK